MADRRFGRFRDVYVYRVNDGVECCACSPQGGRWFRARTHGEMIAHLPAGHAVPRQALEELRADAAEMDEVQSTSVRKG